MSNYFRYFAMSAMLVAALSFPTQRAAAQTTGQESAAPAAQPAVDETELTMEQALQIPEVPAKQNAFIRNYMKREALALHKLGYKVETMRKGEIVIATIPTDKLFGPNSTTLLPSAIGELKNFIAYFRVAGRFKVVLAVHTDDTGSDSYLTELAEKRVVALYDFFDANAPHTDELIGYPVAANEPVNDNSTRAGRSENRRLEIYILPGAGLIEEAKKAK